jgi:hypothetical protein
MSKPVTVKTTDYSGRESFSFGFYCDKCGNEWRSPAVPFTKGGLSEIAEEEARQMIWGYEHKFAYEQANLEAHLNFNHCPVCGSRVCDTCFNFEEQEHGGACYECCKK